jgi:hypothetical protein
MNKFVFLYEGGQEPTSAEGQKASMETWNQWFAGLGESVVEMGVPMGTGMSVDGTGATEAEVAVNGYSVIRAADIDEAVKLAEGCPVVAEGGLVHVYPAMAMA